MDVAVPNRAMDITSNVTCSGLNVRGDNSTIYNNCTIIVNKPSTHCKGSKRALTTWKTCDNRSNIFRDSWVTGGRERCTEDSMERRRAEYDDFIKKTAREYARAVFLPALVADFLLHDYLLLVDLVVALVPRLLDGEITKQDVQWTAEQFGGEVRALYSHFYSHLEVLEEDVEDIRKNLRNETSAEDEVYKVLKRSLRGRKREYLLRKLFELDENLARAFIKYLLEEIKNENEI